MQGESFWDRNDICELTTQELALVRDERAGEIMKPKILVFCKFIRTGSALSVKFYPEPFEIDIAADADRRITKVVNNQAQIKAIRAKLKERGILQ